MTRKLSRWLAMALCLSATFSLAQAADAGKGERNFAWAGSENVKGDVLRVAFSARGEIIAAVSDRGVLVSRDGGKSWQDERTPVDAKAVYWLAVDGAGAQYAVLFPGGVLRKAPGDSQWKHSITGLPGNSVASVVATASGNAYIALPDEAQPSGGGVYQSIVDGSWKRIGDAMNTYALAYDSASTVLYAMNCGDTVMLPVPNRARCGGHVSQRRADEKKWTRISQEKSIGLVMGIATDGKGNVYAGSDRGVFRRLGGAGEWTALTKGLPGLKVEGLAADREGNVYAGVWGHGMYWLPAGSDTWRDMKLPQREIFSVDLDGRGRIAVGTPGTVWIGKL